LPTASPVETTVYTFSVIDPATTCSASDSLAVTVIRNYDIWVPTAFSPNGDSNNDFFFVRGNNVKEFSIRIFDKWGAQLYESANLAEGWNGEFKNKKINTGVFVYILDFTLNDGTAGSRKGNISVSN
jgi:gliding motility-associated-like protein